jgi:hypothetical protein
MILPTGVAKITQCENICLRALNLRRQKESRRETPLRKFSLWASRTETASRLRGRIEDVLDWAKPALWRDHPDEALPGQSG